MDSFRYVLAIIVVVTLPPALVYWFIVHPFARHWRRLGPIWTISLVSAALLVLMGAMWDYRVTLLVLDLGFQPPLLITGGLFEALACWIGYVRQKQLDLRTLVGIPELEASSSSGRLLTMGLYAKTRNPRYLEVWVGILGLALMANYLGAYLTVLLSIPTLQGIVLFEERELRERFGEAYDQYCRRVPRWLPMVFRGPRS